jgi:hypothetical protein
MIFSSVQNSGLIVRILAIPHPLPVVLQGNPGGKAGAGAGGGLHARPPGNRKKWCISLTGTPSAPPGRG